MNAVTMPTTWPAALSAYSDHLRARGLALSTVRLYRRELQTLAGRCPDSGPWDLDGRDLCRWLTEHAPATQRSYRKAAAGFYGWAVREGMTGQDPTRNVPRFPELPPRPRPVREADYAAALALAPTSRDRLLVRLAGDLGLRCAEVAAVHVDDLHDEVDGWWLTVQGKGAKVRALPLSDELADELRAAGRRCGGWVFPNRTGGHLTSPHVGRVISRLLPPGYTAHKLRHRFATRAYGLERDVCAVQDLLGHSRPATTAVYVQTTTSSMRTTLEALERAR